MYDPYILHNNKLDLSVIPLLHMQCKIVDLIYK